MIGIKNLKKYFGDACVLNDINLNIDRGIMFGLIGRSGAGKSTLLRCINGLVAFDEGCITVDGINVKSLSATELKELRKDIGMIFQNFSLLSRLSVYENIALPLRCWKYSDSYIDKRVKDLLEIIGIPDKINAKPGQLSGGQKQRVAIARALTMQPKILLCDEATSALDPQTTKSILSLLNTINRDLGITIVIVTHEMPVLKSTCDEIAILENGNLEASGPIAKVFLDQPAALKNLIGENEIMIPESGVNIELFFTSENAFVPVITKMGRELDIDCTIIGGEMATYKNTPFGSIIINIKDRHYNQVEQYLERNGVHWKPFNINN